MHWIDSRIESLCILEYFSELTVEKYKVLAKNPKEVH